MNNIERRDLITAIVATASAAAAAIGLVADVADVSKTVIGQTILLAILLIAVGYVAYFIYSHLLRGYLEIRNRLQEIKRILVDFTSKHSNMPLNGIIDADEIKLIEKTKRAKSLRLNVQELERLGDREFKIIINKGNNDGLLDAMRFKIFHNSRMNELGLCPCTTFESETTLAITIDPACMIAMSEVTKDKVEVRLIEPAASNKVNLLVANLLYKIDYG